MIFGAHVIVYTQDAEGDRAFLRDVLGFEGVDAGDGWLIFALPPAELAAHPSDTGGRHELYLMCDDLDATVRELRGKGVHVAGEPSNERWGRVTATCLPGGGELGRYEPAPAVSVDRHGRPGAGAVRIAAGRPHGPRFGADPLARRRSTGAGRVSDR